ncbi:probable membrane-associated kinase regulator 2 [Asparagus officinalis]|nr:probable membrane-associated kinase regulator 2 [Asparagus officinalis]
MLRFKKSKSLHLDSPQSSPNHNKKFPVKFKLDEVPIVSLFTKENSSSRSSTRSSKLYAEESIQSPAPTSDEKKNPKDVIHRYLNKIKPLYDRASKRNSAKPRFSGDPPKSAHSSGLRIVSRRLRKSRSASASVAAVRSPPRRREESVIVEEDGIQSAIAHCKRSFSSGCDLGLVRSRSDPGTERCD